VIKQKAAVSMQTIRKLPTIETQISPESYVRKVIPLATEEGDGKGSEYRSRVQAWLLTLQLLPFLRLVVVSWSLRKECLKVSRQRVRVLQHRIRCVSRDKSAGPGI
jgi:hypothetical protein